MAENIRQSARRAEAAGIKYKETDLHRERRHDLQDGAHKYDPIQHEEDEYWQKREDEENRLKEAAEQQEAEDLRKKQMAAEL